VQQLLQLVQAPVLVLVLLQLEQPREQEPVQVLEQLRQLVQLGLKM
jgi:hypothetical protein